MKILSTLHRTTSILLGVLAGLAGIVALGYTLEGIDYLKFFKDNLVGGLVGVEAVMVRYPREGHGLREPRHIVDSIDRSIAWYEKHFPKQNP